MAWRADNIWGDDPVICIASGPSLTHEDVDLCRGHRVIAVSDNWKLAPWADAVFAIDALWWTRRGPSAEEYAGLRVSVSSGPVEGVNRMTWDRSEGLALDRTALGTSGNSGQGAVNLAFHLSRGTILLLGYDMKPAEDGKIHWFGDHPAGMNNPGRAQFMHWVDGMNRIATMLKAQGRTVLNCSRDTALKCFPRMSLEECLPAREPAVQTLAGEAPVIEHVPLSRPTTRRPSYRRLSGD